MDESSHAQARLALKAAQATLSEGINRLRVASNARLPGTLAEEGEYISLHMLSGLPRAEEESIGGAASLVFSFRGCWVLAVKLSYLQRPRVTPSQSSRALRAG